MDEVEGMETSSSIVTSNSKANTKELKMFVKINERYGEEDVANKIKGIKITDEITERDGEEDVVDRIKELKMFDEITERDVADGCEVDKKYLNIDNKGKAVMSIEPADEMVNDISDNDDDDDGSEGYDPEEGSGYESDDVVFKSNAEVEAAALQAKFDAEDLPAGAEVSVPWLVVEDKPTDSSSSVPEQFEEEEDEVMLKFKSFKSFDTVVDFSDHHYQSESVTESTQASQKWVKAIQRDWRLLEKDLPDTIFVRAYEERMDLLRAVIVGAAGTPYHDGLFFFDVYFPSDYPDTPPLVNYHAHNLRLNPNLYNSGYVCLSLLNTWQGHTVERWTPGQSTMLQVLLSIQALVLNEKPYFNEPGYEFEAGTVRGEKLSQEYNEDTFILSCKTMQYTLKNPPKHFEEYVLGHFRLRAQTILATCKAYIEGAQIGSVVEEEVQDDNESEEEVQVENESQKSSSSLTLNEEETIVHGVKDVNEGQKSCTSLHFKNEVGTMAGNLAPMFISKGAKNCEQFICLGDAYRLAEANYSDIFKEHFYKPVGEQVAAAES
ncbi:putative ubiquitin-conjugating enzyme E2 38 [Papaver somniferum]|uniref:putative ubiquitin-conjugating enzyme E2 38 n=1 Tax=Papaver somniferum TaxID=3469 RepID=UPI000E700CA9|nr:putative ubiquitin-conjugating enzyme E2 38 [Papaver somniferum]